MDGVNPHFCVEKKGLIQEAQFVVFIWQGQKNFCSNFK